VPLGDGFKSEFNAIFTVEKLRAGVCSSSALIVIQNVTRKVALRWEFSFAKICAADGDEIDLLSRNFNLHSFLSQIA
jgi:hypothetical protein